jgi:hypothetical protein
MLYENRPIKEVFGTDEDALNPSHLVRVIFGDDKEPHEETMHKEELEGMQTDGELEKGGNMWEQFVFASLPLRSRVMKQFEDWNIRIEDLYRMRGMIEETWKGVMDGLNCRVFGIDDAERLTFFQVSKKREGREKGETTLDDLEADLLELLLKHEIKLQDGHLKLMTAYGKVGKYIDEIRKLAIGDAVGVPYDSIRTNDIYNFLQKYDKEERAEGSSNGSDGQAVSSTDTTSTESANQGNGDVHGDEDSEGGGTDISKSAGHETAPTEDKQDS